MQNVWHLRRETRRRPPKSKALTSLNDGLGVESLLVECAQEPERVLVLDTLGDHERPCLSRERGHCHQHGSSTRLGGRGGDDASIKLHELSLDRAQHLKTRVARADIVDRDLEALLTKPVQAFDHGRGASPKALSHLDDDSLWRESGLLDCRLQPVVSIRVQVERQRREVDEDEYVGVELRSNP